MFLRLKIICFSLLLPCLLFASEEKDDSILYINGYPILVSSLSARDNAVEDALYEKAVGELLLKKGVTSQAVLYFQRAVEVLKDDVSLYFYLGSIFYNQQIYLMARFYYIKMIEIYARKKELYKNDENLYIAYIYLGNIYHKINQFDKGYKTLSKLNLYKEDIKRFYPELLDSIGDLFELYYGTREFKSVLN